MVVLSDPPNYEPAPGERIARRATERNVSTEEFAYDALLSDDGHSILYLPIANYVHDSLSTTLERIRHPNTVIALGDGGAHYGMICDASYPTFALTHWVRDRSGERIALQDMVHALTRRPAEVVRLNDRGLLAPGYKADINVIDFDHLKLLRPEVKYDLPAGGRRMVQRAEGYVATIVSGEITYRDGEATANLPGRLVRGERRSPLHATAA